MTPKEEYIEYLKRYIRSNGLTLSQANMEACTREVGKSYGLTEFEMSQLEYEFNKQS